MTRKGLCGQPSTLPHFAFPRHSQDMLEITWNAASESLLAATQISLLITCVHFFITSFFESLEFIRFQYLACVRRLMSRAHVWMEAFLEPSFFQAILQYLKSCVIHDVEYGKVFKKLKRRQSRTWFLAVPKASSLKIDHKPKNLKIGKNPNKSTDSMQILEVLNSFKNNLTLSPPH